MRVVLDNEVGDYCLGTQAERLDILQDTAETAFRPGAILPIFEMCRAFYFLVSKDNVTPSDFLQCWDEFVAEHWSRTDQGYLYHVTQNETDEDTLVREVCSLGGVSKKVMMLEVDDPRDIHAQHLALTERFRRLSNRAIDVVHTMVEKGQMWATQPPEELPRVSVNPSIRDQSLVLDTNVLLEVLNSLTSDGWTTGRLRLSDRISHRTQRWCRSAIETSGLSGKMIVPANVLEEAERVASRSEQYRQAREVLLGIAIDPDRPAWRAFVFRPLTQRVLSAFICLIDRLLEEFRNAERFPHFGDALVLAHGIAEECPVASSEWNEGEDWSSVSQVFQWMVI